VPCRAASCRSPSRRAGRTPPSRVTRSATRESTSTACPRPAAPTNEVYTEGIQVGYRWYDAQNIAPLFPFGHGLSYTTFAYSNLRVQRTADHGLTVRVRITNTGSRAGTEVPQVYVGRPPNVPAGVQTVPKTLAGFQPVTLSPRQATIITIDVSPRELSYWSTREGHWVLGTGERSVLVGSSSRDIRLQGSVNVR
jgi:beta-glucosidase